MKRRDFIKISSGSALAAAISSIPVRAVDISHLPSMGILSEAALQNDHVLVIVRLSGGNDGLNTIIPVEYYPNYRNARKDIAIPENNILPIAGKDTMGFHPVMDKMRIMYEEEKLSAIQSVGYPNPNFSHFRATDIWMSGSNSNQYVSSGWGGRFLDETFPDYPSEYPNPEMPDPLAIEIGSITTLTCQGPVYPMAMSLSDPTEFYELISGDTGFVPNTNAGRELEFLRITAKQTNSYLQRIVDAADKVSSQYNGYPEDNNLAQQLKIVAQLITGGLKSKIYMVSIGGFDTHAQQVIQSNPSAGAHANLLSQLSEALFAFQSDLQFLDIEDRVIGFTYSEFGRRIIANASLGTDHGAAGPMFLFGTNVVNNILGDNPTIPSNPKVNDNIPYQYDFRSVYATILEKWFCIDKYDVQFYFPDGINTELQTLPIIKEVCSSSEVADQLSDNLMINTFPNPATDTITIVVPDFIQIDNIQLINSIGKTIKIFDRQSYNTNNSMLTLNIGNIPPGNYYLRIHFGNQQKIASFIKI